jgi:hypothetical protein
MLRIVTRSRIFIPIIEATIDMAEGIIIPIPFSDAGYFRRHDKRERERDGLPSLSYGGITRTNDIAIFYGSFAPFSRAMNGTSNIVREIDAQGRMPYFLPQRQT